MSVLIVGLGPVGVLNALGLARQGIPVTLLERGLDIADSPRAMVYHWSTLDGLEQLGILEDAIAAGFTKTDLDYRVFATGEVISMSMDPLVGRVTHPYNLHLGQNELARIALQHLERYDSATVIWGEEITDVEQDDTEVRVKTVTREGDVREHHADWLIGADGAGSVVRHQLGLSFDGITWEERFVATNVRYDFESYGWSRSNNLIDPAYGAIISKIDTTGLWRVTYMEDASLPEEGVLDRMPAYFDAVLPGAKEFELVQYSPYRMHQRSAPTYRVGRILLAGDSAHATNPTGGLGLTSGLFDSYTLIELLPKVIRGELPDSVLDRYSDERRRIFTEIASPSASENKRFVYSSTDPERLEEELAVLRATFADPERHLRRLLFPLNLKTPEIT